MGIMGSIKNAFTNFVGNAYRMSPPSPQLVANINQKKTQLGDVDRKLSSLGWSPADKATKKELEGTRSGVVNDLYKLESQAFGIVQAQRNLAMRNIRA